MKKPNWRKIFRKNGKVREESEQPSIINVTDIKVDIKKVKEVEQDLSKINELSSLYFCKSIKMRLKRVIKK